VSPKELGKEGVGWKCEGFNKWHTTKEKERRLKCKKVQSVKRTWACRRKGKGSSQILTCREQGVRRGVWQKRREDGGKKLRHSHQCGGNSEKLLNRTQQAQGDNKRLFATKSKRVGRSWLQIGETTTSAAQYFATKKSAKGTS